jgi:DNA excision repair protein ERCC-2
LQALHAPRTIATANSAICSARMVALVTTGRDLFTIRAVSVRVDFSARRVEASVRALIESEADPLRGRGEMASLRAALGVEIHQRRQGERAHEDGYTAEVEVAIAIEVDGWQVRVHGRADGVRRRGELLEVEEIKSVQRTREQLRAMDGRDFADACLQAQIYALCVAHTAARVEVRLWVCSVLDGAEQEIEVPFERDVVEARLQRLVRSAIARAEAAAMRTAALRDVAERVRFPFDEPRPQQVELSEAIAAALDSGRPAVVMAPTGSGKTAAAMVPALAHALRQGARLFWATAKTTQQALAADTLRKIVAAEPLVRATTLRARAKMCPPGDLRCHPQACSFLADYDERARTSGIVDALVAEDAHVDPDRIYTRGSSHRLCPYELALDVASRADVIIGDYNYAFDPAAALRPFREDDGRPAMVVIDEAHNLPDRARGYASPFLPRAAIRRARGVARADEVDDELPHVADRLLHDLEAWIDDRLRAAAELELEGVDACVPIDLATPNVPTLASRARRVLLRHHLHRLRAREVEPEDPLLACLRLVVRIADGLEHPRPTVIPYLAGPGAPSGPGVGLQCVDAASQLEPAHRRTLGTVAMSATLAPLPEQTHALGLASLHPRRIEIPSPFPAEHRLVVVVPSIRTTFRERDDHLDAIARAIETTVHAHPGRYAAFFPSFAFATRVRERLDLPRDQILVQIPGMPELARRTTLAGLHDTTRERLLLAVSGGIFAEGIDLPGDALTGAIVVGPALPSVSFERELIRRFHDDHGDDGFARAYVHPGMQRAVQAAGRVIRTMTDRGVIVLLGHRFLQPTYAACLPDDWISRGPEALATDDLAISLAAFWSDGLG